MLVWKMLKLWTMQSRKKGRQREISSTHEESKGGNESKDGEARQIEEI